MSRISPPLAVRLRPRTMDEFVGQEQILGKGKLLYRIITSGRIPLLIFYGPPGTGKTTLGFIIARRLGIEPHYVNAAFSSVSEIKKILKEARVKLRTENKRTLLFIDEIHRFNKVQQEALIPDTEEASIAFIGATIYNPRYYLIRSLLSRAATARFNPLNEEAMKTILIRALKDKERGLGSSGVRITDKALSYIITQASGDARKALASLELGAETTEAGRDSTRTITLEVAKEIIQKNLKYDKKGEYHYDTISAFIKSIRGSDPDSALYWLAKMVAAGEDMRFVARRLVILASEDIGNADPAALTLTMSAFDAVEAVGAPEAQLILAQATTYLCSVPKSNASSRAFSEALDDVQKEALKEVPSHLKTHSSSYKYPHAYGGYVSQDYGVRKKYYNPAATGEEKRLKRYLESLNGTKDIPPRTPSG